MRDFVSGRQKGSEVDYGRDSGNSGRRESEPLHGVD